MGAPLLTLGGLRARFARQPESLLEVAGDVAHRFASSGKAYIQAPIEEAARNLLSRYPDPSALPLWGVPYVVDANIDVVGLPTSIGVPALDFQPDFDADVIARLRAAGALLVGKVPIDPIGAETPAAQTALSVAAGLAAFGIASDRGGATATPCSGVVAIEPTLGLISTEGLFAIAPELDGIVIFSPDLGSGTTVRCLLEKDAEADGRPTRALLRLGFLPDDYRFAAMREAGKRLGLVTVAVENAAFAEFAMLMDDNVWLATRLDDIALVFAELPDLFPPFLRGCLAGIFSCPVSAQIRAQNRLLDLRRRIKAAFDGFDLLLMPPETNLSGLIAACELAAVVLPDGGSLIGPGGHDDQLAAVATALTTPNLSRSTRPIDIQAFSPLAHR